MKLQILNRWTGQTIIEGEAESLKLLVLSAVKAGKSLRGSDFRGSDLRGSDFRDSDLRDSDLRDSDLRGSNFRGSDFRGSNLRDSDLRGSNLRGSDLRGSNLRGSNLRGSDLRGSDLRDSDLRDSDLRDSDLSGSDLRDSDLRGSDLSGSDLRGSNLSGSNLRGSNLTPIRDDFFAVLSSAPAEVAALRAKIVAGEISGTAYEGACACLVGTIANARDCRFNEIPGLAPDPSRPIERFFMGISKGQTPENHEPCRLVLEWLDEFVSKMKSAFGSENRSK